MKGTKPTLRTAACLVGLALTLAAAPAAADILHLDDVIIDGSLCVGFDCVNGESFGFDTIRLKENNLRIHFLDTSVAASFPPNDWRIVINDSANGGSSYFAVEDASAARQVFKVFAGARSNALVVDSQGDVGIGTATPTVDLHVKTGDTPTLRLEQDTSSGFAPQTWDVAGNETNFFVRDVTNGSALPIRSRPGAPTSSLDIAATGNVGIGTGSPDEELHVRRTDGGPTRILVENTGANQTGMQFINASEDWRFTNDGAGRFVVNAAGGAGNEFVLDGGDLTLTGTLVTGGGGLCDPGPCDGVFRPDEYTVESIEEHAAYMWENEHLWGVGPTPEGAPLDIPRKTTGILHELEKAHIYIEQLNSRVKELEAALVTLTESR